MLVVKSMDLYNSPLQQFFFSSAFHWACEFTLNLCQVFRPRELVSYVINSSDSPSHFYSLYMRSSFLTSLSQSCRKIPAKSSVMRQRVSRRTWQLGGFPFRPGSLKLFWVQPTTLNWFWMDLLELGVLKYMLCVIFAISIRHRCDVTVKKSWSHHTAIRSLQHTAYTIHPQKKKRYMSVSLLLYVAQLF